jgi:hypothetical protein
VAKRVLLGYESRHEPLLGRRAFARRVARSAGAAAALVSLSLAAGMIGYHSPEGMAWVDAFANAAMIRPTIQPSIRCLPGWSAGAPVGFQTGHLSNHKSWRIRRPRDESVLRSRPAK